MPLFLRPRRGTFSAKATPATNSLLDISQLFDVFSRQERECTQNQRSSYDFVLVRYFLQDEKKDPIAHNHVSDHRTLLNAKVVTAIALNFDHCL